MLKIERVIRGPGGTAANSHTEHVRETSAVQPVTPILVDQASGPGNADPTPQTEVVGARPVVDTHPLEKWSNNFTMKAVVNQSMYLAGFKTSAMNLPLFLNELEKQVMKQVHYFFYFNPLKIGRLVDGLEK